MSRNNLFLLIASAIAVTIMSHGPMPLPHPTIVTIADLPSPGQAGARPADIAMLTQDFGHQ